MRRQLVVRVCTTMPKVLGNRVRFFPSTLAANANFYFKYSSSGGIKMKILNVLDGCLLHLARARACSRLIPPRSKIFLAESRWQRFELLFFPPKWSCRLRNLNPSMAAVEKQPKRCFHSAFFGAERDESRSSEMEDDFPKKKSFSFIRLHRLLFLLDSCTPAHARFTRKISLMNVCLETLFRRVAERGEAAEWKCVSFHLARPRSLSSWMNF